MAFDVLTVLVNFYITEFHETLDRLVFRPQTCGFITVILRSYNLTLLMSRILITTIVFSFRCSSSSGITKLPTCGSFHADTIQYDIEPRIYTELTVI